MRTHPAKVTHGFTVCNGSSIRLNPFFDSRDNVSVSSGPSAASSLTLSQPGRVQNGTHIPLRPKLGYWTRSRAALHSEDSGYALKATGSLPRCYLPPVPALCVELHIKGQALS
jgi:hypothetical protein